MDKEITSEIKMPKMVNSSMNFSYSWSYSDSLSRRELKICNVSL